MFEASTYMYMAIYPVSQSIENTDSALMKQ